MSLWYCNCHGLQGPMARCPKASLATIRPLDTPVSPEAGASMPATDAAADVPHETPDIQP